MQRLETLVNGMQEGMSNMEKLIQEVHGLVKGLKEANGLEKKEASK